MADDVLEPVELEPLNVDDLPPPPREPFRIRRRWLVIGAAVVAAWFVLAVVTHDDVKHAAAPARRPPRALRPPTTAPIVRPPQSADVLLDALRGTGSGRFAAVIDNELFVLDANTGRVGAVALPNGPLEIAARSGDALLVRFSQVQLVVNTRTRTISPLPYDRFAIPAVDEGHWWFVRDDGVLQRDGGGAGNVRIPTDLRFVSEVDGGFLALGPRGYVIWNAGGAHAVPMDGVVLANTPRTIAFRNECSVAGCTVEVYDRAQRTRVSTRLDVVAQSAVFSPTGTRLAVQPTQSPMFVIDTATGAVIARSLSRAATESAPPFTWTADGRVLLVVQPDALEIRDIDGPAPPREIVGAHGLQQLVALP